MTASPLATVTLADGTRVPPKSISSPLKRSASAVPSSNGTPRLPLRLGGGGAAAGGAGAGISANMDLSEILNEEEKNKYIKG